MAYNWQHVCAHLLASSLASQPCDVDVMVSGQPVCLPEILGEEGRGAADEFGHMPAYAASWSPRETPGSGSGKHAPLGETGGAGGLSGVLAILPDLMAMRQACPRGCVGVERCEGSVKLTDACSTEPYGGAILRSLSKMPFQGCRPCSPSCYSMLHPSGHETGLLKKGDFLSVRG